MADGEAPLAVLGGRACVGTKRVGGTVRFVGPVAFAEGIWVGLEIDEPSGKNNGTVKGVEYFNCADLHGLFLRPSALFPEVSSPSEVIAEDVLQMDQAQHPKPTDTESSAQAAQQEGNVEQKEKEQGLQAKQSQDPAEASNSSNQTAPASGNASPPKKLQKSTTKRLPPSKAASKANIQSSSTAEESSASAPLTVADQRSDEVKREDTKESGGASVSKPIEREGKLTNDRGDENLTERFSALESMTLQQMLAVQDRVASLETELSKRASNIVTDASANCAVHTEDQQQAMLDRMEERLRSRLAESREQLQMDQEKFGDRIRKLEIWSNGQHQSDDSKQISKLDTMCEDRLSILERRTDSLLEAQESSRRAESPQYDGRRNEEAPESESRLSAVEKRLQDCESRSSTAIEQARTAMVAIDTYEHELQHLRAQDQALEVRLDAASFQANSNSSVRTQLELEENRSPEGHMEYDFGSLGKRIDVQASALNGYIAESRKTVQLVQAQIESCKAKTQSCDEALGRGSNPELISLSEKEKDDVSKLDSERMIVALQGVAPAQRQKLTWFRQRQYRRPAGLSTRGSQSVWLMHRRAM